MGVRETLRNTRWRKTGRHSSMGIDWRVGHPDFCDRPKVVTNGINLRVIDAFVRERKIL